MLHELRVQNLLLIEDAALRLAPGLNVLTGETGAGKTVLAHALDLLLGGKAKNGIVRPGTAEAYVEGIFDLPDDLRERLGELIAPDAEELVLARRVTAQGRTRAYMNGRAASAADLREAASRLLAFYGQHEHHKLTIASAQLDLLDGFCGVEQRERRGVAATAHAQVGELESALRDLQESASARERELDLILYELREIGEAQLETGEHEELLGRRERLRHIESLRAAALAAEEALTDEDGGALVALSATPLGAVDGVDTTLDAIAERWRALAVEADDVARELRSYVESLEAQPGELDIVEERLAVIERLCRKHGGSVEFVFEHARVCEARRDEIQNAEEAFGQAETGLADARRVRDAVCEELRAARLLACEPLAAQVRERLEDLAMPGASFEIVLGEREPGPSGADTAEFMIAPNPGVPAAPLRESASGGELSRVMLALMSAAGAAPDGSTLVFDEVDAGIGGHTARAVGERLSELADGRQLLCITHLPQVASHAARHFSIEKDTSVEPARTTVRTLAESEVVGELVRMLGGDDEDLGARRHAKDLLAAAA